MKVKELTEKLCVSYINKGLKSDGKPLESRTGDTMQIVSLKDALNRIRQLSNENIDNVKGEYGALYVTPMKTHLSIDYIKENHIKSGGVMFIDIDHIEEHMDKIYDAFEYLCSEIPNIIAIVSSHSGKGYHIFVWTEQLEAAEYTKIYCQTMAMIVYVLSEHLGIDFTGNGKTKHVDLANSSMKQKFYLSSSKYIKINPEPKLIDYSSKEVKKVVKMLEEKYPYCFKETDNTEWMNEAGIDVKSFASDWEFDVTIKDMGDEYQIDVYIPHRTQSKEDIGSRIGLYGSLQFLFKTKEETNKQWERCVNMMQLGKHSLEFLLNEPKENGWFTRNENRIKDGTGLGCNTKLLEKFGIYVDWICKNNNEILDKQLDWLLSE